MRRGEYDVGVRGGLTEKGDRITREREEALTHSFLFMAHNDPRDPSLESTFTIPETWRAQDSVG